MSSFLYLFGPAGCGKSTLMSKLLHPPIERFDKPVPHMLYAGGFQLGRDLTADGSWSAFPGVDRISKSQGEVVKEFLHRKSADGEHGVAEGQWLAYHKFFDFLEETFDEFYPVYVAVPREELMRRRYEREEALGREVDEGKRSWWKTEDTRFERLFRTRMCEYVDNTVDATGQLADHPVITRIKERI